MQKKIVTKNEKHDNDKPTADDPFHPDNLRLSQNFSAGLGVKKVLTLVPCRKPNRHEFFRVRSGEDWHVETGIFEDKIQRDIYLVGRDMWGELAGEISPVCLYLTINKQEDILLWPCKMPGADGRSNSWNDSALKAAELAQTKWVRMAANMQAGYYDVFEASGELADPEWPELTFHEILKLCFKDRIIENTDHPVLRALRGEA